MTSKNMNIILSKISLRNMKTIQTFKISIIMPKEISEDINYHAQRD